jgi:hypothetical protein
MKKGDEELGTWAPWTSVLYLISRPSDAFDHIGDGPVDRIPDERGVCPVERHSVSRQHSRSDIPEMVWLFRQQVQEVNRHAPADRAGSPLENGLFYRYAHD